MPQPQTMSPQMQQEIAQGPPYPPQVAGLGGVPTVGVDVPVLSVLIVIYLSSFVTNIGLFQYNRRHGHFFLPSALLGGFSMARVLTCVLRIVWACKPHDVQVAIAAQIFFNAGILIIYIVNLLFAQRILRALHPKVGWHRAVHNFFLVLYVLIGCCLVMLITMIVYEFYTLKPAIHSYALWIQRGVILYFLVIVATPLFLVPLAVVIPHSERKETFGKGSLRTKVIVLMAASCLCTLIAGFKTGYIFSPPRPVDDPSWIDSKACFYCFSFMLEIMILVLYTSTRIDQRFHVHNGSSKRKTYAQPETDQANRTESDAPTEQGESELEKRESGLSDIA